MITSFKQLIEHAKSLGEVRIAVVSGHDLDALVALQQAELLGLAKPLLIGDAEKITEAARRVGLEVGGKIISATDEGTAIRTGIELVRTAQADLLMKGKVTTASLIRAVLDKERGLRGDRTLSQVIVFRVPGFDRLMIMTDASINIAPTLEQKADICRNAIEVAHVLGIAHPNVALLAALEFVNPAMPATVDAAALVQMNRRGQITGAYLEGPLALDVPLSKFAAERKGIETRLCENTNIFIAPDIEAANILYRAIVYFARGESGGIIVGAKVPLLVLSRAEPPETKLHSIALALTTYHYQREGCQDTHFGSG